MKGKTPISFETEGGVLEEAKAAFNSMAEVFTKEKSYQKYQYGIQKMFDFFKDDYDKNIKLLTMVQEMNAQIVFNATKINLIMKSTYSDSESLTKLKQDFDDATAMVQSIHKSEIRSKEILKTLREQLAQLTQQVQSGQAFNFGTQNSIFEISQDVKNLRNEKQKDHDELTKIQESIDAENIGMKSVTEAQATLENTLNKDTKTLSHVDKRLQTLTAENEETSNAIIELKPIVTDVSTKIENAKKTKNELTEKINVLKNTKTDVTNSFNTVRNEVKARKDRLSRRKEHLNEVLRFQSHKNTSIQAIKEQITDIDNEIEESKTALKESNDKNSELVTALEDEMKKADQIAEEKAKVRNQIKELRPKIVEAALKVSSEQNEKIVMNRQLSGAQASLAEVNQLQYEEKHAIQEIKNATQTLKSETATMKGSMQSDKDKIIQIFQEIDKTRTSTFKLQASINAMKDSELVAAEENERLMKEHANLMSKSNRQTDLSEQLRDERNNYARLLKIKEDENAELQQSINELEHQIQKYTTENQSLFNQTINSHFQTRDSNDKIDELNSEIQQYKTSIQKVERIISHLQAENTTLSYIINESNTDKILVQKETTALNKTVADLMELNKARTQQIEQLRSDIQTKTSFIHKCAAQYKEKLSELEELNDQLKKYKSSTEILEQKADKLNQLQYTHQKLSSQLVIEERKYITLIHELAIPRNVHRWQVMEAVDPGYVKNIRYRMQLTDKLDDAHRLLEKLQKERDDLKKDLDKKNADYDKSMTREQVKTYIERYKSDCDRMDQMMEEMSNQIKNQLKPLKNSDKQVLELRGRVNKRREAASSIKNEIYTESHSLGEPEPWFITEGIVAPAITGGGFVANLTPPEHNRKILSKSNHLTVGVAPILRNSRSNSMFTSARSTGRPYRSGKTILPPMPE